MEDAKVAQDAVIELHGAYDIKVEWREAGFSKGWAGLYRPNYGFGQLSGWLWAGSFSEPSLALNAAKKAAEGLRQHAVQVDLRRQLQA